LTSPGPVRLIRDHSRQSNVPMLGQ
jgi:hypothetical protein